MQCDWLRGSGMTTCSLASEWDKIFMLPHCGAKCPLLLTESHHLVTFRRLNGQKSMPNQDRGPGAEVTWHKSPDGVDVFYTRVQRNTNVICFVPSATFSMRSLRSSAKEIKYVGGAWSRSVFSRPNSLYIRPLCMEIWIRYIFVFRISESAQRTAWDRTILVVVKNQRVHTAHNAKT